MIDSKDLGKGLIPHSVEETGVPIVAAEALPAFDWNNIVVKNTLFPGTDQGQSSTCQTQAYKMAVKRKFGIDLNVENIYCHIFVAGGGGYLIAPGQYTNQSGYVLTDKYPEVVPETEASMEKILVVQDGDVLRAFQVTQSIFSPDTIDACAAQIMAHDAVILGIWWTGEGFAKSLMHPSYTAGGLQEGHALCTVNPIIYDGLHAIDCQTSWEGAEGADGPCTHHVIDQNFFGNGGVFEILTLDFKEITGMLKITVDADGKTINLEGELGKIALADEASLAIIKSLTADAPVPTGNVPQVGILEQGFVVHK